MKQANTVCGSKSRDSGSSRQIESILSYFNPGPEGPVLSTPRLKGF